MLTFIAPFGVADGIHSIALAVFPEGQWVAFVVLLSGYVYILSRVVSAIYSRIDFSVATALRQRRIAPPEMQHWFGNFIEALPRRVAFVGLVLTAGTVAYAVLRSQFRPVPSSVAGQVVQVWAHLLRWLWA